jgi:hypothetical protein
LIGEFWGEGEGSKNNEVFTNLLFVTCLFSLQSGVVLIFGCLVGGAIYLFKLWFNWTLIEFTPSSFSDTFYKAFLPLIIFSGGFTMKKAFFFFFLAM